MNNLKSIRDRLGVSQVALAEAIGMSQGNISHCECGRQELMPDAARRLILFAKERGHDLTFDDVYVSDGKEAA